MPNKITDLSYEAIEPTCKRLRLAHDHKGNVFIMTSHTIPYTAPYQMATLGLYRTTDEGMETYKPVESELQWVHRMRGFAKQLGVIEA